MFRWLTSLSPAFIALMSLACTGSTSSSSDSAKVAQATTQREEPPRPPKPKDKPKPVEEEPTYKGIPKSKYVKALKDKDRAITDTAVKALAAMGKPAEEDLYAAFEAYHSPAALSISSHWYQSGKDGVPWYTRALKAGKTESAALAAAQLINLHKQHACLPKGSDLRKQAEAALKAGESSEDAHIRNVSKASLPLLADLP